MVKMVWKDFYSTRKQAFKEGWNGTGISMVVAMSVINYLISNRLNGDQGLIEAGDVQVVECVLLWCSFLFQAMYPNRLSRLMFLVPTDKAGKRNYLKTVYWCKVVIMSGIQMLGMVILGMLGHGLFWYGVLLIVAVFLLNMLLGILNFHGQFNLLAPDGNLGNHIVEWCAKWASIISYILLVLTDVSEFYTKGIIVCGAAVMLQAVLCIYVVKKRYNQQLEHAMEWEKYYKKQEGGKL